MFPSVSKIKFGIRLTDLAWIDMGFLNKIIK